METVKRRTINNVATGLTWGHSQDPWRSDSPKQQRSEIARETGGVGSRDFGRAASTGCRRLRRRGSEALEEGAWGRNLLKVSPPLAQPQKNLPLKKRHPIKRLMRLVMGARNAAAERCTAVSQHLIRRPWWHRASHGPQPE